MKNKLYIALAALAAAALVYALFFRASDEDRIRRKLGALEAAVKSGAAEPNVAARALRIQQSFARIFAPRVRADIPELASGDRSWRRWPRPARSRSPGSTSPSVESTWRSTGAPSLRARTSTRWRP